MKRLKQIVSVFARLGFYDLVSRVNILGVSEKVLKGDIESSRDKELFSTAQRVRMAFEELGPTFIKLGQMLSLEPDILPPGFEEEFKKLQDEVPPFSYGEVIEIIEVEFEKKTRRNFSSA